MASFDYAVIGSGPAGYVSAIRAAQLGFKTALVEKDDRLGGTCLNVGCIPSKALLESSEHFAAASHKLADFGVKVKGVEFDIDVMQKRKGEVVTTLTDGIAGLMKKNKVEVLKGHGRLVGDKQFTVTDDGKTEQHEATHIVRARQRAGGTPVHEIRRRPCHQLDRRTCA